MMTRNCIPMFVLAILASTCLSLHAAEFPMGNPAAIAQSGTLEGAYSEPARLTESGARSAFDGESGAVSHVRVADTSPIGVTDPIPAAPAGTDDSAAVEFDSGAISRGVRTSIPSAAPSVPAKSRAGNRWQSLVPGALK